MLYSRPLHPELFAIQGRSVFRTSDYEVESWLMPAGHVVRFQHGEQMLTETVLEEARGYQITKIFTLTYKPAFFEKFGFRQIDRSDLPLKIWSDCIICVKFPDCDEIAMLKEL